MDFQIFLSCSAFEVVKKCEILFLMKMQVTQDWNHLRELSLSWILLRLTMENNWINLLQQNQSRNKITN